MSKNPKVSSLIAPSATGGDIAEGGFQYQANLVTARIPGWLAQDGFTEMIRESLGDTEAKFFVPGIGLAREFIEYKNHRMAPHEFWTEIGHFQKMAGEAPGVYRRFILACTGVSENLETMINALRRVRDPYPFYDGAQPIQSNSYDDFVRVVEGLDKSRATADFLFAKVWFEIDLTDAEDHPRELFRESLLQRFPIFDELPHKASGQAYSHLVELVKSRKNRPISRAELEKAIWDGFDSKYRPNPSIRIYTLYEVACKRGPDGCLEFDWISIFGGADRNYPPADVWNKKVLGELQLTKDWIISTNCPRILCLSGNRRLSASIAIGSVFSSVSGFVIGMDTKDGVWSTNSYPTKDTPDYHWEKDFREGKSTDEMVVGIGVMRSITSEVDQYLTESGFHGLHLHLFGAAPMLSAEHTNQAVNRAKAIISDAIVQSKVKRILLFVAVPAPFALFLGHRLNAICEIQCHERQEAYVYLPTCLIVAK